MSWTLIGLGFLCGWMLMDIYRRYARRNTFKDDYGNKYLIKKDGKIERL